MILCIGNVLTPDELKTIGSALNATEFVDGQATAGWHAKLVKQNLQAKADALPLQEAQSIVQTALHRNALFQMAVRPKAMRPLLFNRYDTGMFYGSHIDNAIMGDRNQVRSDVSMTLFLSSPSTYAGGELVIEDTQGSHAFKLDAGSMIVYPSSTLHRVEPVTQGIRLAVVTWIQSFIRDASDRELLFDLDTARQAIFQQQGKTQTFDLLTKVHANLIRKWAEL
ncbi:Fe2+-dependent dioxygenase [Thermocoleostomius sinensis]|jgi:PKHD-type hydroxylase|uniref:Fe2+-dependent dioxygenase n=1 Tax=Thermocoleostomius sinensis A174 TaxID=2016057 RepID=A0A9E9C9X0_9CYAN|nr:Fe2+-dependent dioxygenase [Thermocoleostomius sinensis]WAL62103.1 Fe2+-dependent dioxygenase [Thermocoleostomius sinensis A174]